MEEPDFWNNPERSQELMKELKSKKDDVEIYHRLTSQMEDMELMIEMGYEENDPEVIPEIQELLDEFEASFENIRMKTLLSGEYDSPVTGQVCCIVCTPDGHLPKDLKWKCWIIWTVRKQALSLLHSRCTERMPMVI